MKRTKKQIANVALWIAALRSGEYRQTTGCLTRVDDNGTNPKHCCLGVACVVTGVSGKVRSYIVDYDFGPECEYVHDGVMSKTYFEDTFGLNNVTQYSLTAINDHRDLDFKVVADVLEAINLSSHYKKEMRED